RSFPRLTLTETVALGALAGLTIYLGLPFGRIQLIGRRSRVALAMFSVGVLAFLFVDIFEHAFATVEKAVEGYSHGEQGIGQAIGLIIGFALHNATEGFGILGPLGAVRPSWRWLGLAGLVGGGPVFLGAIVGYNVTSQPLELAFYGISGGAILYVIGEVWTAV